MPGTSTASRRATAGAVVTAWVLLATSVARSDGRVQFLADRLAYPPAAGQIDDFRVRTNAALALAATNDDGAVTPLCSALDDPSEVVRQAVAVALRRLAKLSSVDCLKARAARETNSLVKAEIARALDALASSRRAPAPASGPLPNARYYVAISHVTNHTYRPTGEIDEIVRGAIAAQLQPSGQYQIAPPYETLDRARAVVAKQHLKGYFLSVSVDKFDYSDEGLRVQLRIAVFSYPGKDLRGELPVSGTLPGARPGDRGAEDQLTAVISSRAAELFSENFQ